MNLVSLGRALRGVTRCGRRGGVLVAALVAAVALSACTGAPAFPPPPTAIVAPSPTAIVATVTIPASPATTMPTALRSTPTPRPPLAGHAAVVTTVAFSPDGKTLVSGGLDGAVKLRGLATGTTLQMLTGHRSIVYAVAFSPDGRGLVER